MEEKPKRKFKVRVSTIIAIIVSVILLPILIMNITIVVKAYINPNETPDFFGIKPFVVLSGSMETTIMAGDLVVMKETEPSTLKIGDIISFKEGQSVVTHRIIETTEKDGEPAFITKGDANNTEDKTPITYSQVEGIYLFRIAKLGRMAMFMQTPIGMLTLVGIPLLGFILYDIIRRRISAKKENNMISAAQNEIEMLKSELAKKSNKQENE